MKFLDQFQTSIKFVLIIFGYAFSNCNCWWQHNRVTWRWKCLRNCWFKKSFCMSELALLHPIDFQCCFNAVPLLPSMLFHLQQFILCLKNPTRPRINIKKLYHKKKWVKRAKNLATNEFFFHICIVIFKFDELFAVEILRF